MALKLTGSHCSKELRSNHCKQALHWRIHQSVNEVVRVESTKREVRHGRITE